MNRLRTTTKMARADNLSDVARRPALALSCSAFVLNFGVF